MNSKNNKSTIKISITILTYNRCIVLKQLLTSLMKLDYEPLELIVVDNYSADQTQQIVKKEFPSVNYIRTTKNLGAVARNFGIKAATGKFIITLDDDIFGITLEDIHNLINFFDNNKAVGALNFKILDLNNNVCNWVHHCEKAKSYDTRFLTYEITEGAVAFRKSALDKVGYYPLHFFLSHEGPDLAFRLLENGFTVEYSNLIVVLHSHSTLGRRRWYNYYYDTRNQFWLALQNFPVSYALKYLTIGIISMFLYSLRDGYVKYWVKGIRDGILGYKIALRNRKVISRKTISILKEIDSQRPSFLKQVKNRLFKENIRL